MAVQAARVVFPAADREEIAAAVADILATGYLTLGPFTRQFEAAFAAAHSINCEAGIDGQCGIDGSNGMGGQPGTGGQSGLRVPHAVAVASGTAALEIILRSIGVAGREVVVPANTFFATAEAALRAGGRPVFADIDPLTFALSPETVLAALTPATAAVMVVHIGGLISPHVDDLRAICAERGIALVEDAAHAHGASYDGRLARSGRRPGSPSFPPRSSRPAKAG